MSTEVLRVRSPDGTTLACWRTGSGPALLAIHGTISDHTVWELVRPLLAPAVTVYALDRRGHGQSADHSRHDLEREVEDVIALAATIGAPVDLLGHSYGGLVALEAALRLPNLRRLILYEPSVDEANLENLIERVERHIAAEDRDAALTTVLADRLSIPAEELAAWRELPTWANARDNVDTWPREARTIARYRLAPSRLHTLDTTTLVLVGEQSPTWRHDACHAIADALPRAEPVTLNDQGHLAMLAGPDHFAATIRRFLA